MSAASSTKFFFFNISETTRASNFKIYHNVAQDSLYISTGNDVTICFPLAANRTNMFILGHGSTDFEKASQFWKLIQRLNFFFCNISDICTQMTDFDFLGNY